ncbi:MAG: hypothetical protein U5L95_05570 [Candidatus Saccharibacteria bacterium]|nr:hypothetical protein [Candidatus Saccharibacteria bacterium]
MQKAIPGDLTVDGYTVFYVNGDVRIRDNITYANSYSSVNDIPHVRFVVKGNIYIDRNVTELHGTYIAQPRDDGSGSLTGGEIYTCAFGFNNPREIESDLQRLVDAGPDGCASAQLRIFGSVVAKGIFLHRLNGTVNDATPQADYNTTSAGEIFVESPLNWLASPRNAPDAGLSDYDAISNPPPVL